MNSPIINPLLLKEHEYIWVSSRKMIFSRKLVPVVFGPDYMYRGSNATSPRIPQVPVVSDGRTVRLSVYLLD